MMISEIHLTVILYSSGVTSASADPAMQEGAQNSGINFFTENFIQQFLCGRGLQ